jgi:hypothetical protein
VVTRAKRRGSVARVCRLTPLCSRTTLCLLSLLHHRGRWVSPTHHAMARPGRPATRGASACRMPPLSRRSARRRRRVVRRRLDAPPRPRPRGPAPRGGRGSRLCRAGFASAAVVPSSTRGGRSQDRRPLPLFSPFRQLSRDVTPPRSHTTHGGRRAGPVTGRTARSGARRKERPVFKPLTARTNLYRTGALRL